MARGKKGKQAKDSDVESISSTKGDFYFTDSDSSDYIAKSNRGATQMNKLTKGGTARDKKQKKKPKKAS